MTKCIPICATVSMLLLLVSQVGAQESGFTTLKGPYIGQKPPGTVPELFAPGVVSLPDYFEHSSAVFSTDLDEVYWSAKRNGERYFKIYFMKVANGEWSNRRVASFCDNSRNYDNPMLSPDDEELFFESDGDIWCVKREGEKWSEARRLTLSVNTPASERLCGVTNDESIYFLRRPAESDKGGASNEIYVARRNNGKYGEPETLNVQAGLDFSTTMAAFVDPAENYLIAEVSVSDHSNNRSLFVSFRNDDKSWSEMKLLQLGLARFPSLSPDGSYLFFMTHEGICWVSARVIEMAGANN